MIAGAMTPDHFHACARCGQTVIAHAPRVCDRCAALERARAGGEPLQLFAPAPAPFPGSVPLEGFYRCGECGGIHDTGARCPNPGGVDQ